MDEDTKTIRGAEDASKRGRKASVVSVVPNVLTRKVSWKLRSEGGEVLSAGRHMPALLIKTSRRPNFDLTCWTASAMEFSEVMLSKH
jgi:hypothetical protein